MEKMLFVDTHKKLSHKTQQSLASLRLEGIILSSNSMRDIILFDTGKISKKELIERAIKRATK